MLPYYGSNPSPWLAITLIWLVMAVALWKLAERTKEEPKWFAIVPILNAALLLKIAKKPIWWLILLFIPLANLVVMVVITMAVCVRFGINKWWGLVALLSPFNLVLYLYLAFGTKDAPATMTATAAPGQATPPAPPQPPAAPHI